MQAEAFPLPLTQVQGTLAIEAGQIEIEKLTASCGDARLAVGGTITFGQAGVHAIVKLNAERLAFDEALRQAIPWRLRRLWNNVQPAGTFDLALDRLQYRRLSGDASPRWEFQGRLGLSDVRLDLGTEIAGVHGVLVGHGALVGAPAELDLDADLTVDRLALAGKPLERLRGRAEASAQLGLIRLRNLQADLCGGRATGEVQLLNHENSRRYEVAATLQDVDLTAFINAGRGRDEPLREASGRIDAHLYLGSADGAQQARRGGGRLLIRDGQLYRLPLISAIRGEAQLNSADDSASQELTAEFFLVGPQVELRDLVLQGRGLALIGAGEIAPHDGALDLTLVAVTPREWVKVPVLTEFLEGASRELVEISVRGTLAEPNIATRPLRSVEAALETLFQKRAARNAP
jgi:hypothetical protein